MHTQTQTRMQTCYVSGPLTQRIGLGSIVYANTMLQFDTNAKVDASVNEAIKFW